MSITASGWLRRPDPAGRIGAHIPLARAPDIRVAAASNKTVKSVALFLAGVLCPHRRSKRCGSASALARPARALELRPKTCHEKHKREVTDQRTERSRLRPAGRRAAPRPIGMIREKTSRLDRVRFVFPGIVPIGRRAGFAGPTPPDGSAFTFCSLARPISASPPLQIKTVLSVPSFLAGVLCPH